MGKQNAGRWTERDHVHRHAEPGACRFMQASVVINDHLRLLHWCASYAAERGRDQLSLRDIPDDLFTAMGASDGATIEALIVLYIDTDTDPRQRVPVSELQDMLSSAIVAVQIEGLRRAGELDVREESPLFATDGSMLIKPVPGSAMDRLMPSYAAAGVS